MKARSVLTKIGSLSSTFLTKSERFKFPKSYGDCTGNQRDRFVLALFGDVEQRLEAVFKGKGI